MAITVVSRLTEVCKNTSAVLFMKSYSQTQNNATNYAARYFEQGANSNANVNVNGYLYTTDGINYSSYTDNDVIADDDAMCRNNDQYWWIASPSADAYQSVCIIYSEGVLRSDYINSGIIEKLNSICPVVSLKPGVQLQLAE